MNWWSDRLGLVTMALGSALVFHSGVPVQAGKASMTAPERTLVDMQILHVVLKAFSTQHGHLPRTGLEFEAIDGLSELREPFFEERSPSRDGWGRPMLYWSDGRRYLLLSTGFDGLRDDRRPPWELLEQQDALGVREPNDIVWRDGYIAQFPQLLPG